MRNGKTQVLQHIVPFRTVITETHILQRYIPVLRQHIYLIIHRPDFFFLIINLIEPFKTYLGILKGLAEAYHLTDRTRQLPDDVADGHHHTQRDIPIHHRFCRKERDKERSGLAKEDGTHLLNLPQRGAFDTYLEQFHLYGFPFPTLLFLTVVQFDFLHTGNELHHIALVGGGLGKAGVVQLAAVTHEGQDPCDIQSIPHQKDY